MSKHARLRQRRMQRSIRHLLVASVIALVPATSNAGVVFSFLDSGGNLTMTSSGSLDTSLLVPTPVNGWGGTGFGTFSLGGGTRDMIGSGLPTLDSAFIFSAGTDVSAWDGGTFVGGSNFFGFTESGTTAFATYALVGGAYLSGIELDSSDFVGSIWTPDNSWVAAGESIASVGLIPGSYTITDASTGEFITIAIGPATSVPEPGSMLLGLSAAGLVLLRRRRRRSSR